MEKDLIDIKKYEHLVGLPYKRCCYDGTGFDCWSLVYHIYLMNNIELPKIILENWTLRAQNKEFQKRKADWQEVEYKDRRFLDVLLFHTSFRLSTHVGLVLSSKYFIHSNFDTNTTIETFSKSIHSALINKVYRWQQ